MGLRGEGGQNSEQERKAPLVLFSHPTSWQERAEFPTAPGLTDPCVRRVPEQGFHQLLTVPSRLLQTPWLSHQSGAFLLLLKGVFRFWGTRGPPQQAYLCMLDSVSRCGRAGSECQGSHRTQHSDGKSVLEHLPAPASASTWQLRPPPGLQTEL